MSALEKAHEDLENFQTFKEQLTDYLQTTENQLVKALNEAEKLQQPLWKYWTGSREMYIRYCKANGFEPEPINNQ